jgi:hypothetical protein
VLVLLWERLLRSQAGQWSTQTAFIDILGTALLVIALLPIVAFAASIGRGYMPPFGWTILLWQWHKSQLLRVGEIGFHGQYQLCSAARWVRVLNNSGIHSYVIVILASIIGLAVTFYWWRNADQAR